MIRSAGVFIFYARSLIRRSGAPVCPQGLKICRKGLKDRLRDEGYLQQDPTRIGFEVNDDYRVINCQGVQQKIFSI
ncbi:hypothetical protein SAMN05216387_102315 [Nitrosovibrio tenuis]|uniref:Uncharacterized protein n=1 Tax=Nitrosovibrio tenuis TaxID=1233 RepID=A0A1H7IVQ9_9PROT|nr:hypothetical protein SAMN05216387_102315 [Nitrosovibrio tenuis]